MCYVKNFCCICLNIKKDLHNLFDTDTDNLTFYYKLTSSITEMCFDEMNYQKQLCKECCDIIDIIYKFRLKCLNSKKILENRDINKHLSIDDVCNDIKLEMNDLEKKFDEVRFEYVALNNIENVDIKMEPINDEMQYDEEDMSNILTSENEYINSTVINKLIDAEHSYCKIQEFGMKNEYDSVIAEENDFSQIGSSSSDLEVPLEDIQKSKRAKRKNPQKALINIEDVPIKTYKCIICRYKNFSDETIFKEHMRNHVGAKTYDCNECTRSFYRLQEYNVHMLDHSGERPFECNICYKTFKKRDTLRVHTQIHSGLKRYQCKICQKKFTQKWSLNTHMQIHTGSRPYLCNICNKTFTQFGNLNVHIKTHSGERAFKCKLCNVKLTQKCSLKLHMQKIHKKDLS